MPKTLLLFVGLFLAYSAFLTRTYYWDGVLFSLYIEKVYRAELPFSVLFHPNHLLYSVLGYALYSSLNSVGLHPRAITLLQCVNVLAGAGAAALLFHSVKRLCGSTLLAIFCFLLFAGGATWWKFSTDADTYILSVLLLLLAISFVLKDKPSLLLAGACHSLAMLFHELSVFLYIPLLTAILLENKPSSLRIQRALTYLLGTSGGVALIYWLAYSWAGRDSGRTFLKWITSFSTESQMTRSWRQILIGYPSSYMKLLGGGKLGLIQEYLSLPIIVALALSLTALTVGIWLMRNPREEPDAFIDKRPKTVLWAWILPYVIFLAWWEPGSAFYKLFVWPPIVLLLGCSIAERPSWLSRTKAWIAFSTALVAWNFGAFIFPHSHSSADPVLALAEKINRELPKNATVYYKVLSPDDWYLQYFAPGRRWLLWPGSMGSIQEGSTGLVCFETTALGSTNVRSSFLYEWHLINRKHYIRFACQH